jgi:hypothetical protein
MSSPYPDSTSGSSSPSGIKTPEEILAEAGITPGIPRPTPAFETTNVDENGVWSFDAPGHRKLAEDAAAERARKVQARVDEPGDRDDTYEDRKLLIPHPWSGFFRSLYIGDKFPPMNLPPDLFHFLAAQIDRLGFRHFEELQLEKYQDPPGPLSMHNPGHWVPRDEWVAPTQARMVAEPVEVPDVSGASPHELEAMKRAIQAEEMRRLREEQLDIHTKVANGTEELPSAPEFGMMKTPAAPRPTPFVPQTGPTVRPRTAKPTPPPVFDPQERQA